MTANQEPKPLTSLEVEEIKKSVKEALNPEIADLVKEAVKTEVAERKKATGIEVVQTWIQAFGVVAVAVIGGMIQQAITTQSNKSAEAVASITKASQEAVANVTAASQEAVTKMTTASQEGVTKMTLASQEGIAQKAITKEYAQAAVGVLSQPSTMQSVPLRTWAAETLLGEPPTSANTMLKHDLIHPPTP